MEDKLQCVIEFEELVEGNLYTIAIINQWLEKYRKYYKRVHDINQAFHLYEIDGQVVRLPPMCEPPTVDEKFLNIYQELDKISKSHLNEDYFKQEIAIYNGIKNEPLKVKRWLKKNETLGLNDFGNEPENGMHIQLYFLKDEQRKVYVDKEDFKYTIEFLETFNELYW